MTPLPPLLLKGDCVARLGDIPDHSIDTVVTSPPYFGLRDYGDEGQGGREETPAEYVGWLCEVFDGLERVLSESGTAWLNLGDSYANDGKWGGSTGGKAAKGLHGNTGAGRGRKSTGIPAKSLMGIPWRVALALQDRGWSIRADVIWNKPNAMPEPVKDRPTRSHEHLFMLTRSTRYFYNHEASQEQAAAGRTRNRRDVWDIPTRPYGGAHFATYPLELARRCVVASTPPGGVVLDPFTGSGTTLEAAYLEGFESIGVELTPDYWPLIETRIARIVG